LTEAGLRWLVVFARYGSRDENDSSSCGLYSESGEELWYYSPEVAQGDSSRMLAAAADLDGDGVSEVVVGLTTTQITPSGANGYLVSGHSSHLVVLDSKGKRLSQRALGGDLDSLLITRPHDRALPLVMCIQSNAVRVFELRP
jgi:hypothetical protein